MPNIKVCLVVFLMFLHLVLWFTDHQQRRRCQQGCHQNLRIIRAGLGSGISLLVSVTTLMSMIWF